MQLNSKLHRFFPALIALATTASPSSAPEARVQIRAEIRRLQSSLKGRPIANSDLAPREFGFFGDVEGSGRYAPWRNEANQAKFKADLARMIDLILAGKKEVVASEHAGASLPAEELPSLPKFKFD